MADLEQSLKALKERIAKGIAAPILATNTLELNDIATIEDVFQYRSKRSWESEPHIHGMAQALKDDSSLSLTPIKIFWIGDIWCCIDGHHRLEAYRRVNYQRLVPILIHLGSLDSAVTAALRGNSRNKLAMTRDEKLNSAWRLTVLFPHLSKATVANASSISTRTVANMRATRSTLKVTKPSLILSELSWNQSRLSALNLNEQEKSSGDYDYYEHIKAEGEKLATRLAKSYGQALYKNPDVLAEALHIINESLPNRMSEHWIAQGHYRGEFEDEEESMF